MSDPWKSMAAELVATRNRNAELEQIVQMQRGIIDRQAAHNRALSDALRDMRDQTGIAIPDELLTDSPKRT